MFLLGARQGVAEAAAEQLQKRYPNLHIGGVHHGYFNKNLDHPSNTQVVSEINSVSPAILLVGFGMPTQEQWLKENLEFLNVNVVLSCGAAFDYASGRLPRPPKFMRVLGLEWLGRLLIEPRRLGRRYAIGIPKILVRLVLDAIRPVGSEVGKA
jgi:N-acetylglucosaminyldiphosphoundecaprenol N-acetyl-beta-D-mannosaminyltransferase